MRLFGILGTDFCGSTFLSRLFWCVDGAAGAGELHWLIDGKPRERQCFVCGPGCSVLPQSFCMGRFDALSVYQTVADKLGVDVLVASDKHVRNYRRLCGPRRMEAGIVLYKTPQAQCASDKRNLGWPVERSMEGWQEHYKPLLGGPPTWCQRFVYVSYEDLASSPRRMMRRICGELGLPAPDAVELRRRHFHHIGGNTGALESEAIRCDDRWRDELSAGETAAIDANHEAWALFEKLASRSLKPDG